MGDAIEGYMQSSGAQPGNFRAYRVWRAPWVGRPGCPAHCLVGVPPSGWAPFLSP